MPKMSGTFPTLIALATLSVAAPMLAQTAYSAGPSNLANVDSTPESDSSYTQPAAPIERSNPANVYATPNGAYATLDTNQPGDPQNGPQHAPPPPGYDGGGQPRNTTSMPVAGVWLVTAPDASVKTVPGTAGTTEIRVEHGRANVNVHHPADHSEILVDLPGGQVSLLKDGLYTFNAESNTVRVLHGEAETVLAEKGVKGIKIKEDHELVLGATGKEAKAQDAYPEELRADLLQGNYGGEGGYRHGDGYGEGFYGYPYAYGYPYYGFYGPGWGYPYYAFGGPWGYPYGVGLGFGYYGGFRGGWGGGYRGFGGGFRYR